MQFWRIQIPLCHDVYYKSFVKISPDNVARNAVIDGEMDDSFISCVTKVEEITAEQYYEKMYD